MGTAIEELKKITPPIPELLPGGFTQATASELAGPCPKCGGVDRFRIWTDEDKCWCRHCNWGGDRLDVACFTEGVETVAELAKRRLPPDMAAEFMPPVASKKPAKTSPIDRRSWEWIRNQDPRDSWAVINEEAERIETHTAALLPFLQGERKIPEAVIRAAVERGSVAFHLFIPSSADCNNFALDFTPCAAFRYTTPRGKVRAVQYASFSRKPITRDRGSKKFEVGSELSKSFFFTGQGLKVAGLVVLCEAPINALSVAAVMPSACAVALGSSNCRKQLKRLAPALEGKRVVCAFDNDPAGRKASTAAAKRIPGAQAIIWPAGTPEKFDLNDLLRAGQGNEIARLITEARPVEPHPEAKPLDEDEVEALVKDLNKEHAIIMIGGKCCVLNEDIDPQTNGPALSFSTIHDFKNRYSNQLAPIKDQKSGMPVPQKVAEVWLSHPKRRQFKGLVFAPGRTVPGFRNLWTGFSCKPARGDWSKYRHLLETIICENNPKLSEWLLSWMARIVQDPGGERMGTSIVLRGPRGTGKGTFAEIFGSLAGDHFLLVAEPSKVIGRFNSQLGARLVIFLDEATWGGDRQAEGLLKHLITGNTLSIEYKGKEPFTVKNYTNLIIASNNSWVIPAGMAERRFLCLDPLLDHIQDHAYFAEIHRQMNNGGREAMLHDLLQLDTSRHNLREAPKTKGLLDQVVQGFTTVERFWYEYLIDSDEDTWPAFVLSEDLHALYLRKCEALHDRHPRPREGFFAELNKLVDMHRARKRIDGRQLWGYEIPWLKAARAQFEEKLRMPIEWDSK